MTQQEAVEMLKSCRVGPDGRSDDREPGLVMARLRALYKSTRPKDLPALHDATQLWLRSDDSRERYDALFLTDEFKIVENRDIIRELMEQAERADDVEAPYRWSKLNRVLAQLNE